MRGSLGTVTVARSGRGHDLRTGGFDEMLDHPCHHQDLSYPQDKSENAHWNKNGTLVPLTITVGRPPKPHDLPPILLPSQPT